MEDEITFMVNYTWITLFSLYNRLNLKKKIRLRNIYRDEVIEISGHQSDLLKIIALTDTVYETIIKALRKLQQTIFEVREITSYKIEGRIILSLLPKYYPSSIPTRKTLFTIDTPSNRLLLLTILELKNKVSELKGLLLEQKTTLIMRPFKDRILEKIDNSIHLLNILLHEPILKPLRQKVIRMINNQYKVKELEKKVKQEILMKRKELFHYSKIIQLRELIESKLAFIEKSIREGEIKRLLTLDIKKEKLYEIFCFTLLLESLIKRFNINEKWGIEIDTEGKILTLFNYEKNIEIKIAYNSEIPPKIQSRLKKAIARGILENGLDAKKLGGLPDTIIMYKRDKIKRIVIDYKYTRNLNYISLSRAKALAYLYEFNADISILIMPKITRTKELDIEDDEAEEQFGFYTSAVRKGGALVEINNKDNKMLIIVFIEPKEEDMEMNRKILERVLNLIEYYG